MSTAPILPLDAPANPLATNEPAARRDEDEAGLQGVESERELQPERQGQDDSEFAECDDEGGDVAAAEGRDGEEAGIEQVGRPRCAWRRDHVTKPMAASSAIAKATGTGETENGQLSRDGEGPLTTIEGAADQAEDEGARG
jgi:hypothetical protein